jgi:hypothetical protein
MSTFYKNYLHENMQAVDHNFCNQKAGLFQHCRLRNVCFFRHISIPALCNRNSVFIAGRCSFFFFPQLLFSLVVTSNFPLVFKYILIVKYMKPEQTHDMARPQVADGGTAARYGG